MLSLLLHFKKRNCIQQLNDGLQHGFFPIFYETVDSVPNAVDGVP